MAQYTVDILETDTLKDSREVINKRDEALRSTNSGTAFPAVDLVIGMHCYREDLKEEYVLDQIIPTIIWRQLPLGVPVPVEQGGTGAGGPEAASQARINLGLGTAATEDVVPVSKGGTGSEGDLGKARQNLGINLDVTKEVLLPEHGGTGQTSIEDLKTVLDIPLGEAGKLDTVTIERGGTGSNSAPEARNRLGLGTAATKNVGTGSGTVPVLNAQGKLDRGLIQANQNVVNSSIGHRIASYGSSGSFTVPSNTYSVKVYLVGGGGGGGYEWKYNGEGGQSGGFNYGEFTVSPGQKLYFTVGAGGAGDKTDSGNAKAGGTSVFYNLTAAGGAAGRYGSSTYDNDRSNERPNTNKWHPYGDNLSLYGKGGKGGISTARAGYDGTKGRVVIIY